MARGVRNSNYITICWTCKNATGGCSWSKSLTPVEGWVVEKTKLKIHNNSKIDSYVVIECPEYVED